MGCGNSKLALEAKANLDIAAPSINLMDDSNDSLINPTAIEQTDDMSPPVSAKLQSSDVHQPHKSSKRKLKYDPRITTKYEVKSLIGKGAYSHVIRVQHRLTRQYYAIKVINSKKGFELFERELSILRRVKHPYIIQLIEVLESNGTIAMVMELATGGDLSDRIASKGKFSEKDSIRVLYMILDGIQYLHSLGITHRDLKPDNLLYQKPEYDSKILITDFGLANIRKTGSNAFMNTACGTPEYVAPEMIARKPYTNSVDMWAIGVIAFIMLSGKFPFQDDNHSRLYTRILRAKYSYRGQCWAEVSVSARDFIDQLLVVEPTKRITATEALTHSWLNPTDDKASGSS